MRVNASTNMQVTIQFLKNDPGVFNSDTVMPKHRLGIPQYLGHAQVEQGRILNLRNMTDTGQDQ